MDWKQLGEKVVSMGLPLLGAALPLPGGAAIGAALAAMIKSPSTAPGDLLATLVNSAEATEKARQFEANHQLALLQIAIEAEKAASAEVSARWVADMQSDSWLAKNIRPLVLISLLVFLLLFAMMPVNSIDDVYVELLKMWGSLVLTAYFIGRSTEKVTNAKPSSH